MYAVRYIKRWPLIGPLARETYRLAVSTVYGPADRTVIYQLAELPLLQATLIAVALGRPSPLSPDEETPLARIERERKALLRDYAPLMDGSLGDGARFDAGTVRRAAQASSKPRQCRLLYNLIRFLNPRTVLEMGTNLGIGSAYLASAIKRNEAGWLLTIEMSPYRLRVAEAIHQRLGLHMAYVHGEFSETLPSALDQIPQLNMAFIDGHHDYQPTLDYFSQILPHASDGALLVFDDIYWSPGMERAWREIQLHPRVELSVDLTAMGLCVVRREPPPTRYRVPRIRGMLA